MSESARIACSGLALVFLTSLGCSKAGRDDTDLDGGLDGGADDGGDGGGTGEDGGDDGGDGGDDGGGVRYDVDPGDTGGPGDGSTEPCDPETDPDCECSIPDHEPCDDGTSDPFHAMGLNCPGELAVQVSTTGSAEAIGIRDHFGTTDTYAPREGSVYSVIGSGFISELDTPNNGDLVFPAICSRDLDGLPSNLDIGPLDPLETLPAPINPQAVGAVDCSEDPSLVGTGDCSNTLQNQWDMGASARDYTDLRFTVTVPSDVISFSYDFAFFTTEWPDYYGSQYNDLYIGWLDSLDWTGNISFDDQGNPITLNAVFFEFLNQGGNLAPELDGTCMNYHGGTRWLETTMGVRGGETITVVFAIMDLSDSILDSYVFLDNWQWGCIPTNTPDTKPPK